MTDIVLSALKSNLDKLGPLAGVLFGSSSSSSPAVRHARTAATIALGLGTIKLLNSWANQRSLNNGVSDKYDWSKEIVLITGGSGGIGDLVVRKLAARGITVISLDIAPPRTELPSNAFFYETDITKPEVLSETAAKIRANHGNPTVLIQNAGISNWATILSLTPSQIKKTFDVNVLSHFYILHEFLPSIIAANHGHILSIASIASFMSIAQLSDYNASKAAVLALHESLRQDLKWRYNASRVRASVLHPIFIKTPLIDKVRERSKFVTLLEPETVADKVVEIVVGGNSRQECFPGRLAITRYVRGFPHWASEFFRDREKHSAVTE